VTLRYDSTMAKDTATDPATGTWRELAVARSLDPARERAEKRVQRFLDAALELMSASADKEFTVQEVVERSGQSLRSFYQYFAGKYELLLALFEESVRSTAAHLAGVVEKESDPLEKLHVFAVEYYRICQPVPKGKASKAGPTPAMAEFAQQLLTDHAKEASRAFVPIMTLFEGLLEQASDAGALRPDLDHQRIAGVVLQAIMFNAFAATISGTSVRSDPEGAAQELWSLILHGLEAPAS
jgi:AcrR family transcriptional regulator